MTLERTNEIGNIRLDDYIFAQIVKTGLTKGRGRAFHASEKGKLLGSQGINTGIGEIASNIKIKETEKSYTLEFYIIMSFGASIRETTKEILDYIEYEMRGLFPDKNGRIILKIVGIKSKKIAARNIKMTREYEAAR